MLQASYYKGDAGDARFMAPEVFAHNRFSRRSDVYSFGLSVWCSMTAKQPFDGVNPHMLGGKIINGDRPVLPQRPGLVAIESLVERCWAPV